MVVLGMFCIGAKHSPNYFRNHVQYFKPIFEGFINIKTTHNNKVYRKAEKSHLLTQLATKNLLSCKARRPWVYSLHQKIIELK